MATREVRHASSFNLGGSLAAALLLFAPLGCPTWSIIELDAGPL